MGEKKEESVFKTLNAINVNGHTEKKKTGNTELTYLSWSWAWAEVKKLYEDISFEIKMFDGLPYIYDEKTGYMVFTSITINGLTHQMWLPVMDGANKAMKDHPYKYTTGYGQYAKEKVCEAATMFDINKTIMRCLVKNLAMFGLGLYIYAGEDLPEGDASQSSPEAQEEAKAQEKAEQVGKQKIGADRAKSLTSELIKNGADPIKVCQLYKVGRIADLTEVMQVNIIKNMDRVVEKCPYEPKEG